MVLNYSSSIKAYNGQVIDTPERGGKCYIARKGNVTLYEVAIPWNQIWTQEAVNRRQGRLYFNIRDYDGDRDKTNSHGGWYVLTDTNEK